MRQPIAFIVLVILTIVKSYNLKGQNENWAYTDSMFYLDALGAQEKSFTTEYEHQMYKAVTHFLDGKNQSAIFSLQNILKLPNLPESQKASTFATLSAIHSSEGDYVSAIENYLIAKKFANDDCLIARLNVNISSSYLFLRDFQLALNTVNEAIITFVNNKDTFSLATALGAKANICKEQKRYHDAINLYNQSYGYLCSLYTLAIVPPERYKSNSRMIVINRNLTLANIAGVYYKLGKADSMLFYLNKIQPEFDLLSDYAKAGIYLNYGDAYTLFGKSVLAFEYYKKCMNIANLANMHDLKRLSYFKLATLYGRQGNYRKAWEYARDYTQLYTEALSEENRSKIGQLHTRYALEKKDKEMAQKELQYNKRQLALQRRNNQLYLWIVSIGLSVVIIGILLRNQYNRNRFLKLQLKNAANESLLHQAQASLRGEETERERIARELHDHVMSELMATQLNLKDIEHYHPELKASSRYENILIQMEETTELLRRTTHNMMPVGLKETGLATTIEAFLYRVSNHQLVISFQCFGEKKKLADSTEKILLSITHELVQNVVKHAHATEALVQLNYYSDSLSLTVEDNGVGMSTQDETRDDGLGWHNIHRNVAALSGTVDIQSSEQEGTTVLIEIPL